jgi:GNAT superfamily N-acetyltransferase
MSEFIADLAARVGDRVAGELELESASEDGSHKVNHIQVAPEFRRQGVATELWRTAERAGLKPRHSDSRSDVGDAWAHAVGGDLPPNEYPWEGEDDDLP